MKHALLQNSQGTRPDVVLDDVFPEGIIDIAWSAESRTLLLATAAGTLTLISRDGSLLKSARNLEGIRSIVWSDTGNYGAAIVGENKVVCLDGDLSTEWDVEVTGHIRALAITPHGSHLAICADSSKTHIVTTDRKQIARIETTRPLDFIRFVAEEPRFVGAAEFGHLCCHDLDGTELWNQRLSSNVGDLSVTSCGRRILLAGFNHGIQLLSGQGNQRGVFMVDGIPFAVAASANRRRIAALTLESRIYWLNFEGDMLWAADLAVDPPKCLAVDPLGERLFVTTQSGRLLQLRW